MQGKSPYMVYISVGGALVIVRLALESIHGQSWADFLVRGNPCKLISFPCFQLRRPQLLLW